MMIKYKTENMILAKFRHRYPQGSLISELIEIDRGFYIVKALVQIDNIVLATALASATTVEAAEDAAKERAIATLFLDNQPSTSPQILPQAPSTPIVSPTPKAVTPVLPTIEPDSAKNHQIVNFSKPPSEAATQDHEAASVEVPIPQPEMPAQVSQPNPESPPVNNLFGETFSAEMPLESSEDQDNSAMEVTTITSELEAMDFNEIKQKTDIEIRRLSWTKEQGKDFLMSRYGKRSRLHLTDEQLLEFLRYLEQLPNPIK